MTLYVGQGAPYTYAVSLVPGYSNLDLSTVTVAAIEVRKPDGSTASWSCALSAQTSSTLTVTYTFSAAPGPLDMAGTWHFYVKLTVPGGTQRTEAWAETVLLEHG